MADVLCEVQLGGVVIQLVHSGREVGDETGRVGLRYRDVSDREWEEGSGSLDWPPVNSLRVGLPGWAFDAEVVGTPGVLAFFGVTEPHAGCSVEFDQVTVALTGPTLLVTRRTEAEVKFGSPLGEQAVRPRR